MAEPIWANHAHVFPETVRPHGCVDTLLRLMDDCGIERAVCFAPFASQLTGTDIRANEWLVGEVERHADRLIGFGTIHLERGGLAEQVTRVRELGFRGIKLHPAVQRCHILSDSLLEIYGEAERQGLVLSFHTGVHHARLSDARLIDFDEIAYQFPTLRFSLEHVGGYAFYREAVGVIQNNLGRAHVSGGGKGTVYAGLTSVFSVKEPHWYLPPSGVDSIASLVTQIGANHIVFGLDFHYKSTAYIQEAIATLRGLNVSDADKDLILGGTLRYVLGYEPAGTTRRRRYDCGS
jgi:predicted TIM-barrel fold metal-dependent hydrolase